MEDETLKYIAMNIETSSAGIEALITSLMEVGITDVVVEDPRDFEELMDKKQSYDWDYVDEDLVALILTRYPINKKTYPRIIDGVEKRRRGEDVNLADYSDIF